MFDIQYQSSSTYEKNFGAFDLIVESIVPALRFAGGLNWLVLKNSSQGRTLWRCWVYSWPTPNFCRFENAHDDLSDRTMTKRIFRITHLRAGADWTSRSIWSSAQWYFGILRRRWNNVSRKLFGCWHVSHRYVGKLKANELSLTSVWRFNVDVFCIVVAVERTKQIYK